MASFANNNITNTALIVLLVINTIYSMNRRKYGGEHKEFFTIISIFILTICVIAMYLTWS
jgi:Mg2+ and Co2+ transporter CorA